MTSRLDPLSRVANPIMRRRLLSEGGCTVSGSAGTVVQIALAVLVSFVLLFEYLVEFLSSKLSPDSSSSQCRSFRTFWFDSYKICAGALVSHMFNIVVTLYIGSTTSTADQCAVYALAFFYEACGVPFVQLLQYGLIQYALKMAKSEDHRLSAGCKSRWNYISKPGIYGNNRYPVDDCIHCRRCEREDKVTYCKIAAIMLILIALSVGAALLGSQIYSSVEYVVVSIGFLAFVFLFSTAIAPISSLWQTTAWIVVKCLEKSMWTLFAMAQASYFADWSTMMGTGNSELDAWLYIAAIPIVMNAFMFFMFSRISRLKLPCFAPKYAEKIDKARVKNERRISRNSSKQKEGVPLSQPLDPLQIQHSSPDLELSTSSLKAPFDQSEALKVGVVFMLIINSVLLVIACGFLAVQGALDSIWVLLLSMIVVPVACSLVMIRIFASLIDGHVDICRWCSCLCGRDSAADRPPRRRQSAQKLSIPLGQQQASRGPLCSPSSSSSVQEVL